ncbi:MAG: hypothetical protein A2Z20_10485 [Bdellovibrionales bacterium RBG_16_40_8]|nr:MAG: hypothetical protein A2Z20_10485 [Bdellovibrionales bacterium RBG_16_40_8]
MRGLLFYKHRLCVIGAILICIGCGAKKVSFTPARGFDNISSNNTNNLVGECTRVQMPSNNISGQIGTYYDPATRRLRTDYLNLNLTSVPVELFTSDTLFIQFFRWSEKTVGSKITNQVPVRLFFVDKLTGVSTPSSLTDRLSKGTITQAKNVYGNSWSNVSLSQFFERSMVVLTGMDLQYQAITFAIYDTATGTTAIAQSDVLLPPFYSNPNVYRSTHPAPGLYSIHPNYSHINSNASESDYYQMIEAICYDLSGIGARIPASVRPKSLTIFTLIWYRIVESLEILFH